MKTIRYGEADLIVHTLTRDGAKLNFFARSALKSRKRFGGGVLEPSHYVEVSYRPVPSGGASDRLITLNDARLIESFPLLRKNYDRLRQALLFLQTMNRVCKEGDMDSSGLFNLLGHALKCLETEKDVDHLRTHFDLKLLATLGVLEPKPQWMALLEKPLMERTTLRLPPDLWAEMSRESERLMKRFFAEMGIHNQSSTRAK